MTKSYVVLGAGILFFIAGGTLLLPSRQNMMGPQPASYQPPIQISSENFSIGTTTQFSASVWFKRFGVSGYRRIFGLGDAFLMRLNSSGKAECIFTLRSRSQLTLDSSSTPATNATTSLICTYDGVNAKLYLDGSLEASTTHAWGNLRNTSAAVNPAGHFS